MYIYIYILHWDIKFHTPVKFPRLIVFGMPLARMEMFNCYRCTISTQISKKGIKLNNKSID